MTERYIDDRYPPYHPSVRVPLYPMQLEKRGSTLGIDHENDLIMKLALNFASDPESITLGCSGSLLIREYIGSSVENDRSNRSVAVPHYSCQSLVDALVDADAIPVFYDIEDDTRVGERAIQFAVETGCKFFIWPVFFGSSERDSDLTEVLRRNNIAIIFDDAQADVFSPTAEKTRSSMIDSDIVVYSFGKSKMLAGNSGGALYSKLANPWISATRDRLIQDESIGPRVDNSMKSQPRYSSQRELLEAREHEVTINCRIAEEDARAVTEQIDSFRLLSQCHEKRYDMIRAVIVDSIGETALRYLNHVVGTPTTLAVWVPESNRFGTLAQLATEGIQSTWYYYPIHRVSRYRKFLAQEDKGAAKVANSVVVLPFKWTHSAEQIDLVASGIKKLGNVQ